MTENTTLEELLEMHRASIGQDTETLLAAKKAIAVNDQFPLKPEEDRGEVMENITLAIRHLEDARMRIGKALQARDGGVSVYKR